jgi:Protein of unknown function (DUF2946)
MGMNSNQRRIAAWIACFAILLASLVPSVSRVLAAGVMNPALALVSQEEQEICPRDHSPTDGIDGTEDHSHAGHGLHQVSGVAEADLNSHSSHSPEKGMHFDHCPFCFTHAGTFGLLPAIALSIPVVASTSVLPSLFLASPRPLFAWIAAQSRAPPSIS